MTSMRRMTSIEIQTAIIALLLQYNITCLIEGHEAHGFFDFNGDFVNPYHDIRR
jgi:hypothetical protein